MGIPMRWRWIFGFLVLATSTAADIAKGKDGFASVIDSKLNAIRKPAVKSIQSSDGDIIDCVDIYNQPAFDHPALKNHIIQMKPSFVLEKDTENDRNKSSSSGMLKQIWQKNGSCPEGTVPIRRVRKQDLLRFDNLERFGKKGPPPMVASNSSDRGHLYPDRTLVINNVNVSLGPRSSLSSAQLVAMVVHYTGARGTINIWNPRVARWDEYSTGQIWLQSGNPKDFESVQAGWIVNQKLYGDMQTRFFTYWTADASQKTGCFDLICSGFLQTSSTIALGGAFTDISGRGGVQYVITVQITLDVQSGNWWLTVNNESIGYWPASLFTKILGQGATSVMWGGEVHSEALRKTPHTTTAMGSGEFAGASRGYDCFIEHIAVLQNPNFPWAYPLPENLGIYVDEIDCYSAYHYVPSFIQEPTLFFGGPGQCSYCP